MKNIAIIPARGGSKRIPGKNIKDFLGKPIMAYSIHAALDSNLFEEVMVSTDDKKIARIAKECGAKVPFLRSEKNSDDFATTAQVLIEVLKDYENKLKVTFSNVCCLYPTAPFVTPRKLRDSFKTFELANGNSLVPVVKYSFPPQRAFILKDETLIYNQTEYKDSRSQDLVPLFHDAGQFYWVQVKNLLKTNNLVTGNTIPFYLRESEVQDIDTHEDWIIATLKYQAMEK
jgi:pseudaminic acid cytidylyltransferase